MKRYAGKESKDTRIDDSCIKWMAEFVTTDNKQEWEKEWGEIARLHPVDSGEPDRCKGNIESGGNKRYRTEKYGNHKRSRHKSACVCVGFIFIKKSDEDKDNDKWVKADNSIEVGK
jgi:hypothetical protein